MSPIALALVMAAAAFHASWNRAVHITGDRVPALALGYLLGGVLLAPFLLGRPPGGVLLLVALSAIAETAYALCLAAAYQRGALSVVYPLARGVSPALVGLGGWAVLGQRPGPVPLLGSVLLLAGMATLAAAGRRAGQARATLFALLTGTAIATYSVIDARAIRDTSAPGYLGAVLLLAGLLLTAVTRRPVARMRRALRPAVVVAVGSTAAYLLVLLAFRVADAGRVSTVRESSVLIGIALSRERPGGRVWAGASLILGGALLAAA